MWQKHSLRVLVRALLVDYPGCKVCGHRDLSPDLNGNGEIEPEEWVKQCPCFDVSKENIVNNIYILKRNKTNSLSNVLIF